MHEGIDQRVCFRVVGHRNVLSSQAVSSQGLSGEGLDQAGVGHENLSLSFCSGLRVASGVGAGVGAGEGAGLGAVLVAGLPLRAGSVRLATAFWNRAPSPAASAAAPSEIPRIRSSSQS